MKSDNDIEVGAASVLSLSTSSLAFRNVCELLIADSLKEDSLLFDGFCTRESAWRTSSIREMTLKAKLSSILE